MDETVDFRPYLDALLRHWRLLLAGTLAAGLLAAGLSALLPPTYEANALVLAGDPRESVQLDPRFEALDPPRPVNAYPELATSESLLDAVLAEVSREPDAPGAPRTRQQLREMIAASAGNDPNLIRLTVFHREPATAALVANRWAELFVAHTNAVLGDQGSAQLQTFASQRDAAQAQLDTAETTLAEFLTTSRWRLVAAQLTALESALAGRLAERERVAFLQRDIVTLRSQLATRGDALLPGDHLAVTLLYLRAFGDPRDAEPPGLPVELQLDGTLSAAAEPAQLIAALDALQSGLAAGASALDEQIAQLEPQILALQSEQYRLETQEQRLRQEALLAQETYTALARRVTTEEITAGDLTRGLQVAGRAPIPEQPVAPRVPLNGVLTGVVTLVMLAGVTLFRQWRVG
jgi:uncharacterized protein involved in exopolysaccharide biosynthesis